MPILCVLFRKVLSAPFDKVFRREYSGMKYAFCMSVCW